MATMVIDLVFLVLAGSSFLIFNRFDISISNFKIEISCLTYTSKVNL